MDALSSTFFTAAPHWRWLIVLYFFIGGLAGGCYFVAALMDVFGVPAERALARLGYYVAFPAIVVSGLLLIADLERPLRFWHMLIQSNAVRPMVKWYSPMSLGSWALLGFGAFAFLSFLAALAESGRVRRWPWLARLRPPGPLGMLVTVIGGVFGFFVAGYTGVLLAVTNRPVWADTPFIGLVFIVSAASTSAALLILLADRRWRRSGALHGLQRFDAMALVLELVALVAMVISLGPVRRVWLDAWGALLVVGVVLLGIVVPLVLHWRDTRVASGFATPVAAALVLVGGFLLRVVVVLSTQGPRV